MNHIISIRIHVTTLTIILGTPIQGCKMGRKSNCVSCEIANPFSKSNCVSCEIAIPLLKPNCDCEKLRNRNCENLRKIAKIIVFI